MLNSQTITCIEYQIIRVFDILKIRHSDCQTFKMSNCRVLISHYSQRVWHLKYQKVGNSDSQGISYSKCWATWLSEIERVKELFYETLRELMSLSFRKSGLMVQL